MARHLARIVHRMRSSLLWTAAILPVATAAGQIRVVSVSPAPNVNTADVEAPIVVTFDRPVKRESIMHLRSFWAFGRWSGTVLGTFSFADDDRRVTLRPATPFSSGETVMVVLSHEIMGADGSSLRSAGYSWTFWTYARAAPLNFVEIDRMTTRTRPNEPTRAYGACGSDLNRDGFPDLTIVNEDTADLRVFLNRADRTGLFHPFLQPTFECGNRASPSEPADFDRDGNMDICVAAINDNTVSILLGRGDGTFAPRQVLNVGAAPRGIAVLDADGDGDIDVVNTCAGGSGSMRIALNDGNGVFGTPRAFEAGGTAEWSLAAGDMNGDFILDLVIGLNGSQTMVVMTGNGDGTFSSASSRSCDGRTWMNALGDLNGDGHIDVASANSTSNRAVIMFGDGTGALSAPVRYTTDPFPLATDLGDLDGDDDLDWVNSSYSGDWWFFTNDGAGTFQFRQEFDAPQAASCAVPLDFDNDGDLDLALIDEVADVVLLMKNSGTSPVPGDGNGDCRIDLVDYASLAGCLSGPGVCVASSCYLYDIDDDCDVDLLDAARFCNRFTGAENLPHCAP